MVKSKVKYIQSLSHKKQRDEDAVFVAEGPKIINELLSTPGIEAVELFGLKDWMETLDRNHLPKATEIDEATLAKISFLSTPNKAAGIFRKPVWPASAPELEGRVSLMTDNIQDPGNMGSIIRCADWFGIPQVICSVDCADAYSPKTVQSTMGSIARVQVIYADLEALLINNPHIIVYAATLSGKDLHTIQPVKEGIILIGNESKGISKVLTDLSQQQVTIPKKGHAESLNAAAATGILLSHLVR